MKFVNVAPNVVHQDLEPHKSWKQKQVLACRISFVYFENPTITVYRVHFSTQYCCMRSLPSCKAKMMNCLWGKWLSFVWQCPVINFNRSVWTLVHASWVRLNHCTVRWKFRTIPESKFHVHQWKIQYDGNLVICGLIYCNAFSTPWQLSTQIDMGSVMLFSVLSWKLPFSGCAACWL